MTRPAGGGGRTLASRMVRGALVVSGVTALSLAGAAAIVAHLAWEAGETRRVRESAEALVQSIRADARDDNLTLEAAAADATQESGLVDYRLEVWRDDKLLAASQPGPPVGIRETPEEAERWIVSSRPIDGSLILLVASPREHGQRALRIFVLSLGAAAPLCLAVAWLVGRGVSNRATGSLQEFRARVLAATPGQALPLAPDEDVPLEVRDLDEAFRQVFDRLGAALGRERQFVANASHELRTPLARLRLHLERASAFTGPDGRADLARAMDEVDRMARLVDSLLVLAREIPSAIPGEVVNLADLVRESVRRTFPDAGHALLVAPDEAVVHGDENLLSIAIENLIENARKFKRGAGEVEVELRPDEERVALTVTSPGASIAALDRERVFERFYRSSEARAATAGHGLGLALCRHIARLHGGDVRCTSAEDEDARFVLELPAWRAVGKPF